MVRRTLVALIAAAALTAAALPSDAGAAGATRATAWYWSPSWCKSTLHHYGVQFNDGRVFHVQQAYCLGVGGTATCSWNSNHSGRQYSSFEVYVRSYDGTIRAFALHPNGKFGFRATHFHAYRKMALAAFIGFVRPYVAQAASVEQAKGCSDS